MGAELQCRVWGQIRFTVQGAGAESQHRVWGPDRQNAGQVGDSELCFVEVTLRWGARVEQCVTNFCVCAGQNAEFSREAKEARNESVCGNQSETIDTLSKRSLNLDVTLYPKIPRK